MKKLLYLSMLLGLSMGAWAQTKISGTVTSASTGESLPGVSIIIKGTSSGVTTDIDGKYSLQVPSNESVLQFSFVGFLTEEETVGTRSIIDMALVEDIQQLDEIIVVGYGVQKKSVATASVSKVEAKALEGFSVPRVDQVLQGQVSGVTFKSSSGQPGSGQNIFIRGVGTNGDNSPLIIIDGLVASDGILSSLNPADVESVQVLKDGASTAIYGSRAANGIIMVTTKKAKDGEATLNYSVNYGVQSPWRIPEMMNATEYIEATREKYANGGSTLPAGFPEVGAAANDTQWLNELFEQGKTQSHQLSVSKGTEKSSLFASLSYFDQSGVIAPDKSNAKRLTGRFNSDNTVNKYLGFGQNIFLIHATNSRIPENTEFGSPIGDALAYDPITAIYNADKLYGFEHSPWVKKEYMNPFSRIFISNANTTQDQALGNFFLRLTPIEGLTVKSDVGFDYAIYRGNGFTPSYKFAAAPGDTLPVQNELNDIYQYESRVYRWQWENYATYDKQIGKHKGQVTLGISAQERNGEGFSANSSGIPEEVQLDPNFQYIDNTPDTLRRGGSNASEREALASIFGRLTYDYDQKYLFSFTLRRDGSSKFGKNNQYGIFPSVSAGWVISREAFFPQSLPINFMKLRASYGINGNDRIGNLNYASLIGITGAYQFGKPGNQTIYNGQSSLFAANPNVKWEESKQLDIGVEMGLLNDRLTIEIDYYNKTTSDLLMPLTVANYLGNNPPIGNVGEVVNKGFELEARYRKQMGEVNFNIGFNASTLTNTVTKVNGDGFIQGYTWPIRNTPITRMEVGHPIGFFRGYKTDGIFKSQDDIFAHINSEGDPLQPNAEPGDIKFIDHNGDGVIDANDITEIGKPWADLMMGLNLGVDYKGFDIRALFSASIGNQVFRSFERQDVINNNYMTTWKDRWSETNPDGNYPRLTTSDLNNNSRPSDFYVEDASYLRLKSLQIGYSVPTKILQYAKISSFRAYIASENVMTITGYSGFDPEIGTSGWILDTGIDKGFYPQLRSFSVGVNVSF